MLTNFSLTGGFSNWVTSDVDNLLHTTSFTGVIDGLIIKGNNGSITANQADVTLIIYSLLGQRLENANLTSGIYVVVAKNSKGQQQVNKVVL